jgi:hypothetical protein
MKENIKEYIENLFVGISFWIVSVVAMFYVKDESFIVTFVIRYGLFYSSLLIALATVKFIKKIRNR